MTYKKKLIEVALPLEAINAESAREKSIRHGHPSTLHLWWASGLWRVGAAIYGHRKMRTQKTWRCNNDWRDNRRYCRLPLRVEQYQDKRVRVSYLPLRVHRRQRDEPCHREGPA
ncbi:MAG: DUF1156 domain-containing protein [Gracilibacteraceae bacterium]|nr:DUF1156 domain-containing protein [Gracilibacteraceae bacterium]